MRSILHKLSVTVAGIALFTVAASSQDAAKTTPSAPQISISIETGTYDPAPGCNKAVDGCFPKIWTATSTFAVGTRVWIRATLVNHSRLTAYADQYPEIPSIPFTLVEEKTTAPPRLTAAGCVLRPDTCTPAADGPNHGELILSGLSDRWIMPPGATQTAVEEVTKQFVLSAAGEYSVTAETGSFYLTTSQNLGPVGPVDKDLVEMSESAKSKTISFTLTN